MSYFALIGSFLNCAESNVKLNQILNFNYKSRRKIETEQETFKNIYACSKNDDVVADNDDDDDDD